MTNQQLTLSPRLIFQVLFFVVFFPLLPLLVAWRWDWWEAWVYALGSILAFVISRVLAARRHPDLLAERARLLSHADAKAWDKLLAPLMGLFGGLTLIVAGLEARFGEVETFSLLARLVALVIMLAGWTLGSYALIENRFFSDVVRIQTERDHQVVSTGPYRWIRHPGYAGALLAYLATPLFLDSLWAFLPTGLLAIALLIRMQLEDRTLCDELAGYRDYARRVRYRLLPGVW